MDDIHQKLNRLEQYLKKLDSVAVAFSAGVDSTFLLKTAHNVLNDRVIAVTVNSRLFPQRELDAAVSFCQKESIRHIIVDFDPLQITGFDQNPPDRCYLCKSALFKKIIQIARENNIEHVAEGSNLDDLADYRPGLKAVSELRVNSPLRFAELNKAEIRSLTKEACLPTWDKPSFASLASRFVYGETITKEKLKMIDRAEQLLHDLGFHQIRVRIHGKMARIEFNPADFERLIEKKLRDKIVSGLKKQGFTYVSADLAGYRTGSMNETLP